MGDPAPAAARAPAPATAPATLLLVPGAAPGPLPAPEPPVVVVPLLLAPAAAAARLAADLVLNSHADFKEPLEFYKQKTNNKRKTASTSTEKVIHTSYPEVITTLL